MDASLIFPHQLYDTHPALATGRKVYLVEDELFFRQYPFHKQKLVLHRASMKAYEEKLQSRGFETVYVDTFDAVNLKDLLYKLSQEGYATLHYADPTDYLLSRRLQRHALSCGLRLVEHASPNFICSKEYLHAYFNSKKRYFLTDFYIEQRKRLGILCHQGKPIGGKWTFDQENRKKIPKSFVTPRPLEFGTNRFVMEAKDYVAQHFPNNPGKLNSFHYPVTREEALDNLHDFVNARLIHYGTFQDAIHTRETFLFHSVLSPALNIGLLTPQEVLDAVLADQVKVPLNSVEGFARQVLGWREFIRAVYLREGVRQRTLNHWGLQEKLPPGFWTGTTGITPVDNVIQKTLAHAYANHIERLMVLGNFMLLCDIHPDEIYRWFMSLYIDAFDWVMVPNVYGMSQFADGGLMSTKPYVSGSNYVLKMSHFQKGTWCETWDALYWSFIDKHRNEFGQNPRMSMMVRQLDKMEPSRKAYLKAIKNQFQERNIASNQIGFA